MLVIFGGRDKESHSISFNLGMFLCCFIFLFLFQSIATRVSDVESAFMWFTWSLSAYLPTLVYYQMIGYKDTLYKVGCLSFSLLWSIMGGTQYVALGHSLFPFSTSSFHRDCPSTQSLQQYYAFNSLVELWLCHWIFFFWLLKYYAIVFSLLMLLSVLSLKLIGILIFSHLLLSAL